MSILGIDYGLHKVGLAVIDEHGDIAQPVGVVHPNQLNKWLDNNITKYSITSVVIGLPGSKLDLLVYKLGASIVTEHDLTVDYFDETLTTYEARLALRNTHANRSRTKKMEDAIAAALMLQFYLERNKHD